MPQTQRSSSLPSFNNVQPLVSMEDLTMEATPIGRGFFGEVYRGVWRGATVAVKLIYRTSFNDQSAVEMFEKEVKLLSQLRFPHVIQFLAAGSSGEGEQATHFIITQYMDNGNLSSYVKDHFHELSVKPALRTKIFTDVCRGMVYLHGFKPRPIIHRDLCPQNILLDKHLDAVVADFGISRFLDEAGTKMTQTIGQWAYAAPELFRGETYNEKVDVYSYGVILNEVFTGISPTAGMDVMRFVNKVAYENHRPSTAIDTPAFFVDLISDCWKPLASERPTFAEILKRLIAYQEEQGFINSVTAAQLSKSIAETTGQMAADNSTDSTSKDNDSGIFGFSLRSGYVEQSCSYSVFEKKT